MNNLDLDSLGILRAAKPPRTLKWLSDQDKRMLLELLVWGEEGYPKSKIDKLKDVEAQDSLFKLEAYSLADWLRDSRGKPAFLALTWRGREIAELLRKIAQNETVKPHWEPSK